ncbi:MAG: hypothetical protein HFF97_02315 [Oscillibacter sp.]|jgi:hypothetical protein|nr:hypothetical protein [Oscillibacter sp.]
MTASETTAVRPQRRVGTFTLGVVLVAAGCGMLASLLWPQVEIGWLLKASPLILVALGAETLLSARGGGRVKYDWLGMLLCFLLVGAAMVFYAAAWAYENGEFFNASNCSRYADETCYRMDYEFFNGFDSHTLRLNRGDVLEGRINTYGGWLEVEITGGDGETLLEDAALNGDQSLEIARTGDYTILVHGRRTSGEFAFERVPGVAPPEEAPPAEAEEGA